MWIDATVAASFVDPKPKQPTVADKVGFALAPDKGLGKRGNWLWAWSLAIPAGSQKVDAAEKFIAWATSKHYTELVAAKKGWVNVPPGTRTSLYANPEYAKVSVRQDDARLRSTRLTRLHPTVKPVPYVGVQFVAIPEFQGIGTEGRRDLLGRPRRTDQRRRRAQAGAGLRPSDDDQGRLHQVTPERARRPADFPPVPGALLVHETLADELIDRRAERRRRGRSNTRKRL